MARRLSLNDLRAERSELNILRAGTGPSPAIKSSSPTMDVMQNRRPGWATMPVPADDGHGPAGQPYAAATSSATPRAPAGPEPQRTMARPASAGSPMRRMLLPGQDDDDGICGG